MKLHLKITFHRLSGSTAELSMGWADPLVGLVQDFKVFNGLSALSASKVEATELVRWNLHAGLLSCC